MSGIPGSQCTWNSHAACSPKSSGVSRATSSYHLGQWLSGLDNTTSGRRRAGVVFAYMVRGHVRSVEQHGGCAQQPDGVNVFPRHCRPFSIRTALGAQVSVCGFDSHESFLAGSGRTSPLSRDCSSPASASPIPGYLPYPASHSFSQRRGDWSCK